jgi:hypothetical protein
MAQPIKRILFALTILVATYVVGIILYSGIEGWNYLDSAYFLTLTFTTLGYVDLYPKTELGKLLTMAYSWIGIAIGFFFIYELIALGNSLLSKGDRKKK